MSYADHLYRELEAERPPTDPDEDRLYELQRDAEGRGGLKGNGRNRPSPERRDPGPGGGSHGSPPTAVRSSGVGRGGAPHPPGTSSALPRSFATLTGRRYLGRVARVIPPRTRPFNWQVEGL